MTEQEIIAELEANKEIVERALTDMAGLGLLVPTGQLNRNGNPVFVKTAKATAMGDDVYAEVFEQVLARCGLPGSWKKICSEGADKRGNGLRKRG